MNLVFRNNLEIKKLTKVDFETKEKDFVNLRDRIFSNEDMYPGIDLWFKNRVIPGIYDSNRIAYIGYYNDTAIASAVVKIDKSAKFCHLNIDDRFQDCNFGELFFIMMTFDVGRLAEEIHFTLPESLWDKREIFFKSFGFQYSHSCGYRYRSFEKELHCSSPYTTVYRNLKKKLEKITPLLVINGKSLDNGLLLSVQPKYAKKILTGAKTVEIRRKFNPNYVGKRVFIYSSSPIKQIVGEATISKIHTKEPLALWAQFKSFVGCTEEEFIKYVDSIEKACAIELSEVRSFNKPVELGQVNDFMNERLRPPQSYLKLDNQNIWKEVITYTAMHQNEVKFRVL